MSDRNSSITADQIRNDTLTEAELSTTNEPTDGYALTYDNATGKFTWIDPKIHDRSHSIVSSDDHSDKADYVDAPQSPTILTGGVISEGTNAGTFKVSALTA